MMCVVMVEVHTWGLWMGRSPAAGVGALVVGLFGARLMGLSLPLILQTPSPVLIGPWVG